MSNLDNEKLKEKIDTNKLNQVLEFGSRTLKITYTLMLAAIFVLASKLLKDWGLLDSLLDILNLLWPLFFGLVISWALSPVVDYFEKKKISRVYGSIITYLVFLGIIIIVFSLIIPITYVQLSDFAKSAPEILNEIKTWVDNLVINIANRFNMDADSLSIEIYDATKEYLVGFTVDLPNKITSFIGALLTGGVKILFSLMIGFYLLLDFKKIRKALKKLIIKDKQKDIVPVILRVEDTLRLYLKNILLVMVILGSFQTLGFHLAGLEAPLVFGIFCAFTNIIPYIGPYIGGFPAIIVGFSISPRVGFLSFIAVFLCQLIESNFLTPILMSRKMSLHPVLIMINLALCGYLFGFLGMLLATPILSCLKVIVEALNNHYKWFDWEGTFK